MKKSYKYLVEECQRISVYELMREHGISKEDVEKQHNQWTVSTEIDGHPLVECVSLTDSQTNFNGRRLWFVCPKCCGRVRDLYVREDFHSWRCRKCHDLLYACQKLHRNEGYEMIHKYVIKEHHLLKKLGNKYLRTPTKLWLQIKHRLLINEVNRKVDEFIDMRMARVKR